ncbi:MAG: FAD-binding oxidoreductase [Lewinellaceae bacterium]|nr:FAD-binding oxidoreductase [Lewinellaceae bacterium]
MQDPTIPSYTYEKLKSYSGYNIAKPKLYTPSTIEDIVLLVKFFNKKNIKFSMSGSCLSFDKHCLNQHRVISTRNLSYIKLNLDKNLITVGAGTTWQAVVSELSKYGFVPYITPSSGYITVGGSISCDTYSQFTPGYGRESRWVKSLKVITTNGSIIKCSRNSHSDLFYALMGGLGIIAIIYEIEFEVKYVGPNPAVFTTAYFEDGYKNISLIKKDTLFPFQKEEQPGAGVVIYNHKSNYRTFYVKHYWGCSKKTITSIIHRRNGFIRILGGVLMRVFPGLASKMWNALKRSTDKKPNKQATYIYPPDELLFFMDADYASKSLANKVGINTNVLQQSFIIPCKDESASSEDTIRFITYCLKEMKKKGIEPAMIDIGFLPAGDRNAFNLNPATSGYLFSIAVEGSAIRSHEVLHSLFNLFARICFEEYNGKIHLTKNILCSKSLLHRMYADEIDNIQSIKLKYDPKLLLQTDFFTSYLSYNKIEKIRSRISAVTNSEEMDGFLK